MAGRQASTFKMLDGKRIIPPMRTTDPPGLVLASDVLERNTSFGTAGIHQTSIPHAAHGMAGGTPDLEPKDLGSHGGNIAYVDGSVVFEPQDRLVPKYSRGDGDKTGWWPEPR